ncbi:MAG TPA: diheme cytochrome c-553 [Beijerinckiaceae bacterium]|jgi:mono/diheme cytochrome c family protein|nr:diheme cytochrome c-553 [Beijerinckiaceae bacterium]
MNRAIPSVLAAALLAPGAGLAQDGTTSAQLKRGEYLVTIGLCHDCHTPSIAGPDGPGPDMKRALSGHPQDVVVKGPASLAEPWAGAVSPTLTAWSGPWGVSFSANLTPDADTGVLRDFTEQQFIQTLRTGRHQGQGRQILPPMPWPFIGKMTDDDLKAVFAYLRHIPAVRNKVPDPIPPAQ